MILFMPENALAELGITQHVNVGSLQDRLVNILTKEDKDLLLTEISDEQFRMISDMLKSFGINYQVVINIPDIPSPQSFLFEEDVDRVVSFDLLELREKSSAEQLFD